MGKKQKQQKRLIRELEAALAQTLSDWAIERQVNRSLAEERDAARLELAGMTSDVALDAAIADVETLTEENAEADKTIGELRALVALAEQRTRHDMTVNAMAWQIKRLTEERDAALADVETLTHANAEADATIGELRGDLEDTHERLDAALTEAARMRKEWADDMTVAREVIERKSNEIVDLRRTISDLRGDLAKARGELERVSACWQHAEDLLQERERELDILQAQHAEASKARDDLLESLASANTLIGKLRYEIAKLQAQAQQEHANQWSTLCFRLGIAQASHIDAVIAAAQAQQEHAEPVVTLEAIKELEEGERLIDDDGVIIECLHIGYGVYPKIGTPYFLPGPQTTLNLYEQLKAKTMQ